MLALGAVLIAALAMTAGCTRVVLESEQPITDTETVALGSATDADVRVEMAAGELTVSGGADDLMEGEFRYSRPSWKPRVRYEEGTPTGRLTVETPDRLGSFIGRSTTYAWDLQLGAGVPIELSVIMGAGASELDLAGLDIRRLTVNLGAGESLIDLTGPRTGDIVADITAGVGELRIVVPKDVGVRVSGGSDGIGSLVAGGFSDENGDLVNDAYGTSDATIEIRIQRGIGEVTIQER